MYYLRVVTASGGIIVIPEEDSLIPLEANSPEEAVIAAEKLIRERFNDPKRHTDFKVLQHVADLEVGLKRRQPGDQLEVTVIGN